MCSSNRGRVIRYCIPFITLLILIIVFTCYFVKTSYEYNEVPDRWSDLNTTNIYDFLENKRKNQHRQRKELIQAKRPIGFIYEIPVYLNPDNSGSSYVEIWLMLPKSLREESWLLEYDTTKVEGKVVSENLIPNTTDVYNIRVRFDIDELLIADKTIYINFMDSRDILFSASNFRRIVELLNSIDRSGACSNYVF